jgi:tetratricopeptide (TPR) repeat protein
MISHQFSSSYIVDQLLKIVASIDGEIGVLPEIQKSLFRFSVVERLLPAKLRLQNLIRYYESLKREVPWLKFDPHFWLQYGMAQLTYKDFGKAQNCFDQAYAFAAKKHEYSTLHMDNQQARLFLLQATSVVDPVNSYKFFTDAHRLLSKAPEDLHKYRQALHYKDVFEQRFPSFSNANKTHFEHACKAVLKDLRRAIQKGGFGQPRMEARVAHVLEEIVDRIRACYALWRFSIEAGYESA